MNFHCPNTNCREQWRLNPINTSKIKLTTYSTPILQLLPIHAVVTGTPNVVFQVPSNKQWLQVILVFCPFSCFFLLILFHLIPDLYLYSINSPPPTLLFLFIYAVLVASFCVLHLLQINDPSRSRTR